MAKAKRSQRAVLAMARAENALDEILKMDEEPEPDPIMDVDDVGVVLEEMQSVSWRGVPRSEM